MFFQQVIPGAAFSDRVKIQTYTPSDTRTAFGDETGTWETQGERWVSFTNTPMGISPTRMNKTYDDHRLKKKSGKWMVFRRPLHPSMQKGVGFADRMRFVHKRTGEIYVLDQVDWTPGGGHPNYLTVPVVVAPEEQDV